MSYKNIKYTLKSERLDHSKHKVSILAFSLAVLGFSFSAHYLIEEAKFWNHINSYFIHDMGLFVKIQIFYVLPKFGVIFGAISLFFLPKFAFRIFVVSWILAITHTIAYYANYSVIFDEKGWVTLVKDHLIPHVYFFIAVFTAREKVST